MAVTLRLNEAAIAAKLDRIVRPWLEVKTGEVAAVAVATCPVGKEDPLGRPRLEPHMRDTITFFVEGAGPTMRGVVRVNSGHAASVHDGARPHEITPKGAGYPLRFYWGKYGQITGVAGPAGNVARLWKVNHPGNQNPNPWLVRAAETVMGVPVVKR